MYVTHLLRRTFREGGKVKHETLGNISHLPAHVIELIRAALKGESFLPATDSFHIVRSLPHGHVAAVLGSLKKIGLEQLLASRPCPERTLCVGMIVARIISPSSKLATTRTLNAETCSSSLGHELGIESISQKDLYLAMDWLWERQTRIENKLAKKHLSDGSLILYDVSGSYYTGNLCPLAKRGHPRDRKKGFAQILYGLLCNEQGCPVAVEVFEGNRGDPTTLASQVKKILKRFRLKRVILVGDRGMITNARINEDLRGKNGLGWITALRAPAIAKLLEQEIIQPSLFDECDLAEVTSPDYPDERLVVCRNPLLAEERARKREELLQATEKLSVSPSFNKLSGLRGPKGKRRRRCSVVPSNSLASHPQSRHVPDRWAPWGVEEKIRNNEAPRVEPEVSACPAKRGGSFGVIAEAATAPSSNGGGKGGGVPGIRSVMCERRACATLIYRNVALRQCVCCSSHAGTAEPLRVHGRRPWFCGLIRNPGS
ncbi:MAG: IS1634 family transposase [Deltaproteobacteria bacterium]|nr:IS1634 family transposase [Deltaproteobacteria bacterium]